MSNEEARALRDHRFAGQHFWNENTLRCWICGISQFWHALIEGMKQ